MTTHKSDTSLKVYQGKKLKTPIKIRDVKITDKVHELLNLIKDKSTKVVFVSGPAGTAKTFSGVLGGLQLLNNKRVSDILYIRNVVESSSQKMGYLPGDVNSKISPFLAPLMDKLEELVSKGDAEALISEGGHIHGLPVNYLRGMNWNAKYVILDEAQNLTEEDLLTVITRMGEYGKLIICADPYQSDIGSRSGFTTVKNVYSDAVANDKGIFAFEFTTEDIVRSELVKFIVERWNEYKASLKPKK